MPGASKMTLMATEQMRGVEEDFRELEDRAAKEAPGVLEVLRVYGGYEAAIRQMDAYLASTTVPPNISATNTSG